MGVIVISLVSLADFALLSATPILLYVAFAALCQYFFAIPSLLPTSVPLNMVGLGKHSPYPVSAS